MAYDRSRRAGIVDVSGDSITILEINKHLPGSVEQASGGWRAIMLPGTARVRALPASAPSARMKAASGTISVRPWADGAQRDLKLPMRLAGRP